MAKIILTQAKILINSVDLSSWVEQVTVDRQSDEVEVTAFGGTYHDFLTGLEKNTLSLTFQQDFAASAVNATMWPLVNTTTSFSVNSTKSSNSTTNPAFTGTILVSHWTPLDGTIGALSKVSAQFPIVSLIVQATS